jgi:hypothetical protein
LALAIGCADRQPAPSGRHDLPHSPKVGRHTLLSSLEKSLSEL